MYNMLTYLWKNKKLNHPSIILGTFHILFFSNFTYLNYSAE